MKVSRKPRYVALEPYIRAFQYKVLNGILYTNSKLYQIGYISSDLCSFCTRASESLYHLFYFCPLSKTFWSDFEFFWHLLKNENIQFSLQDIIVELVTTKCPSHHLLNYMLLIGKVYLRVCRANKTSPKTHGLKKMIVAKYETERLISVDSETTSSFTRKWFISLENFV